VAPQKRRYRSFKQARAFTRKLGLRSRAEWTRYVRGELPGKGSLPSDIPASPEKTYAAQGWAGMGDWLGTGNVAPARRAFRPFKKARKFARALRLANQAEWAAYSAGKLAKKKGLRPADVPGNPSKVYRHLGWIDFGDWLGTNNRSRRYARFRSFKEARRFVHGLKLARWEGWVAYAASGKRPKDIPSNPQQTYLRQGWKGWRDWLG
jgi:hypothetical protein